jgi:hypothetical protein
MEAVVKGDVLVMLLPTYAILARLVFFSYTHLSQLH